MAHKKLDTIDFKEATGRFDSWDKYIVTCKAADFYTPIKNVIRVNTSDSIKTVLSAMFAYKLQALPVYDPDQDKYRAFVDCYDIVAYLLHVREVAQEQAKIQLPKDNYHIILSHEIAELDIPIGEAMNYGENNFMFMLPENTLLREMLYVMGPGGKHRVWIYHKNNNQGAGLITQTKMLHLLQEDLTHFPEIANKSIDELGLVTQKEIINIRLDQKVLDAFKMLANRNMESLAILDKDGKLENQISANDIRLLSLFGDFFDNLELTISEYIAKIHDYCHRPRESFLCRRNEPVLDVIRRFTSRRVHRLFVVDEDSRPICVVSISDILRSLWPFSAQ